jgi:hypothetical protein
VEKVKDKNRLTDGIMAKNYDSLKSGEKQNKKSNRKVVYIYTGIAVFTVALNILSWCSSGFSDAYILYVFPLWVNTYGRLTGLVDFSVGEWLIAAGLILAVCALVLAAALIFAGIYKFINREKSGITESVISVKYVKFMKLCRKYYIFFAWVFLIVCLIMTLNCFILYHATPLSEKFFETNVEYELEDVINVRNMVVEKCNELSAQMNRDAQERVDYPGSILSDGKESDMQDKAVEAMKNLGAEYPAMNINGYFPRPKAMYFSDFMCQQHMQGYYFPFSMEANYNDVMYVLNKPFTMCHELAHLKGYIYEDEANFIGYLACIGSDDVYFQYSGYLSAFSYLENDLYKAKLNAPSAFAQAAEKNPLTDVLTQVYADNIFVEQTEWDRIEDSAILDTETVDKAADVFIDANLKVNGVSDGALSYNRMVELLMQYYNEKNFLLN